ncbi:3-dehydrosphinganine reductase, partial [Tulasnella sp. 419]
MLFSSISVGTTEVVLFTIGIAALTTAVMGIFGKKWNPRGKHCYVTGGSTGLGLQVAIQLTQKGGNVSIVARDEEKLRKAHQLLESHRVSPEQKLNWYSYGLNTASASAAALEAATAPYGGACPDASF